MINAMTKRKDMTKRPTANSKAITTMTAMQAMKAMKATKAMKKKLAALGSPISKLKLVLGCPKCRGSPKGCGVCRSPKFTGKRGPDCAMKKAMKAMNTMKRMGA